MVNEEHRWEAPGTLELVRVFLNTGLPSNDHGEDPLLDLQADPARWATSFPGVPQPTPRQLATLIELRDGLRGLLAAAPAPVDAAWLSGWFERTGLSPRVTVQGDELVIRLASPTRSGLAESVVEAVAAALADGTWPRLRQCPACQYVFWDRTRNASKIWCAMYAGTDARACGSIDKVRRYRARRAAASPTPSRPGDARPPPART
jgi:predicted RNA-binding Zn ribbon-like protein